MGIEFKSGEFAMVREGHGSSYFTAGQVVQITAVTGTGLTASVKVDHGYRWWGGDRFRKVTNQRAAKFKIGDRVALRFDGEFGSTSATGTVTRTLYHTGYREVVDVKWNKGAGWREDIDASLLYPTFTPAPIPAPAQQPKPEPVAKFKVGDRVKITKNRHSGKTGTIVKAHNLIGGTWGDHYYTVDVDDSGLDRGGIWADFMEPLTTFKAGDKVEHYNGSKGTVIDPTERDGGAWDTDKRIARVEWDTNNYHTRIDPLVKNLTLVPAIKRGDTVVATDVPGISGLNGKRGTVVSGPNRVGSYIVDFPGEKHFYAKVRPLTKAEVEADRKAAEGAKALEAERIAKRVALGKVEKLQRLAAELGYTVHKAA